MKRKNLLVLSGAIAAAVGIIFMAHRAFGPWSNTQLAAGDSSVVSQSPSVAPSLQGTGKNTPPLVAQTVTPRNETLRKPFIQPQRRPADPVQPNPNDAPAPPLAPVPMAREALSYVGADPQANAIWLAVINDPSIEPEARKDLIEDLNQDGFLDPKNLTADDAPLIISRLALIEELAPNALDDVNAAAFQEAYKDLVKMLARLARQ